MEKLSKIKNFYEALENNELVVIYWYTVWCPDCMVIKPHLPVLEEEFSQYKWYAVNRDLNLPLMKHYGILGIPSFTVFKNGDEIGRLVNKQRKTYEEVKTFLEQVTG